MTPEVYSYLLSLIEYDEDCLLEAYNEGETLNSLLEKRGQAKTQLDNLYTFFTQNKTAK